MAIRYEIEVNDAEGKPVKCFLNQLTFPVAEAAFGYTYLARPKFITAGEILLNSLWAKGSPRCAKGGDLNKEAALKANAALRTLDGERDGDTILVRRTEIDKKPGKNKGKPIIKTYKCKLKEIDRDTLEDAMGFAMPNVGNPMVLTAGRLILFNSWLEGDEEIKKDEELLISACLVAYQLIDLKTATIKKV